MNDKFKELDMQLWRGVGLVFCGIFYCWVLWASLSELANDWWLGGIEACILLVSLIGYWFAYARRAATWAAMLPYLLLHFLIVIAMAFSKHPLIVMAYGLTSAQALALSLLLAMRPQLSFHQPHR